MILLPSTAWSAKPKEKTKIIWRVPTERLSTAKRYIRQPDSVVPDPESQTDTRGLPVIMIITAVALLPQIADAILRVYRDYRYGGVLITRKGEALDVSTDLRIPSDTVIVQSPDGTKIYERKNSGTGELKEALATLLREAK
jgi:hypothetical protein